MKIAEIEDKFKKDGFSEDLFLEFQLALKRVPRASRCQHCYTTACELSNKDALGAIKMIEYGLNNCDTDSVDLMRSYLNLGIVYENNKQYLNAKQAYEKSLASVASKVDYASHISMNILRMELHLKKFTYTEYIKELFDIVCLAGDFEKSFRHFAFYSSIAEMIISEHENDSVSYKEAYHSAISALDGNKPNSIDKILNKHKYKNEAKATDASIAYLKKAKRSFKFNKRG